MMKFIRELVSKRRIKVSVGRITSQNKQRDLGIPKGGERNVTLPGGNFWHSGKWSRWIKFCK